MNAVLLRLGEVPPREPVLKINQMSVAVLNALSLSLTSPFDRLAPVASPAGHVARLRSIVRACDSQGAPEPADDAGALSRQLAAEAEARRKADDAPRESFRFQRAAKYPAGLDAGPDSGDMRLFRLAALGGRALILSCAALFLFYIYIGATGGITDGFDRYSEPIEDIRLTMEQAKEF